jgi:hypothetical protein
MIKVDCHQGNYSKSLRRGINYLQVFAIPATLPPMISVKSSPTMEPRSFAEGTHIGFTDDMVRAHLRLRPTSVLKIVESQQKYSVYEWQATLDNS